MKVEICPKKIFNQLLYIIIILFFANVIGIVSQFYFDFDNKYYRGLILFFNFNVERNIPTLYSSFTFIIVSILLLFIASTHKRMGSSYLPWSGLAVVFLFLSIDEIVSIHERFTVPVRGLLNTSGFLFYAWVIPYGIALVVFVIIHLKFLMSLPKKIRILFIVSGAIFVTGAIGFEMLGGRHHDLYGDEDLIYSLLYTGEEFLEMLGIAIMIYALLLYIASQFKFLTISIKE